MPKRKREEDNVQEIFQKLRTELHHALKSAKGFERQRQSKRLRDAKSTPDKKRRIESEILVLKSLDLQQTAHAHICSSLLRIKSIAESPKLPVEIKAGVAKPELTEEEKVALHNVTSGLYNHKDVRAVIDQAIKQICKALGVPLTEKKGKGGMKPAADDGKKGKEAEPVLVSVEKEDDDAKASSKKEKKAKTIKDPKLVLAEIQDLSDGEPENEEEAEKAIRQLDDLLGSSSDEEDPSRIALVKRSKPRRQAAPKELDPMEITDDEYGGVGDELDPMEITDDEGAEETDSADEEDDEFEGFSDSGLDAKDDDDSSSGDDSDSEDNSEDSEDDSDAESSSSSPSDAIPRPAKKAKATKKKAQAQPDSATTGSMFLPSLMMHGYVSGSESASDLDEKPRKNRRGQRARQAIWEKKFKTEAKHLKNQAANAARDSGWDSKRGAVDGENKPWKRGIRNPLLGSGRADAVPAPRKEVVKKRDDEGPLHPSWEAKRKAKALQKDTAPFEGKKITFD
ncbi:Bud-site selection protein [Podospora didyma]|uniref:Bud-site selection protein n=1 Tax=Podospora didyma TaxID=330526 RepID=A0AAE0TW79_9PEZI|nr:Bud-site selection protein [Podospora didyma]